MKNIDIFKCGIIDLNSQKKKNRISFILIFLSIIIYVGVNSTIDGTVRGINDKLSGHDARILYMYGEGDAEVEYQLLIDKFGDYECVQEIYTGVTNYGAMRWYDVEDFLGVNKQGILISSSYESLLNYDYKGEKRLPEYNEVILPRYMYSMGIYDEFSYANCDELIGETLIFKNEAFYEESEEYKLKVIGTYDNLTKMYHNNMIFVNEDFLMDMMWIYGENMVKYHQEIGETWMTDDYAVPDKCVYIFVKEGYNINEICKKMDSIMKEEFNDDDQVIYPLCYLDPEVEGVYYYAKAVGNIVSAVLLFLAIINIAISSITEAKNREWEFALKMAMGYRREDIIKIFAVEKVLNVIKALCTAVFILFLYTNALTYYNQNMEEYWKRSWVITVDLKSSLIALVIIVFTALLGVVFAKESINKINISKTLKAGE